ncbi:hypothetical protein DL98DRAFT_516510 [Cadophora sp. DSE1049]|nr:hypothetical protein DL98DRAFT_516510 [Cadophora sp. DSE1049]
MNHLISSLRSVRVVPLIFPHSKLPYIPPPLISNFAPTILTLLPHPELSTLPHCLPTGKSQLPTPLQTTPHIPLSPDTTQNLSSCCTSQKAEHIRESDIRCSRFGSDSVRRDS